MSLLYDDGQQAIAEEARRNLEARADTSTQLNLLERQGAYDEAFWRTCVEQGWTALALPERFGGLELGLVELGIIAQAAGAVVSGAPFLAPGFVVARLIDNHGDDALRQEWLPRLASGEVKAALAFAEGSDSLPSAGAVSWDGRSVTGVKHAVAGGGAADLALVLVQDALVIVPLAEVERQLVGSFDNSRVVADLVFTAAPGAPLVEGPRASDAALHALALQAVVTAHEATGAAEALMLRARDYANTRRAFGQPIGAFQAVKHKLAELYALVEIARANAIHAASRDRQADFLRAAAAARLSAIEAYDTAARDVVQIHGGIGVTWEAGLHLHQRRARSLAIEGGNAMFWEDRLVDQLERRAA